MKIVKKSVLMCIGIFLGNICAQEVESQGDSSLDQLACELNLSNDELRSFSSSSTCADMPTRNLNTAVFNNIVVNGSAFIRESLTVGGTSGGSVLTGPNSSIPNSVARFVDTSGDELTDSSVLVDNTGNVTLQGITKNGNTVSWPTIVGVVNTFLGSDGAGNLIYGTPAGAGNVDTALPFSADNRLLTTDTPSGAMHVQQTAVTLDGSNNISGVNELTATTVNATLNGDATNFTGALVGDVTGTQGATVVSMVNGETAANIQAGATLANNATDSNTASAIVRRDGTGNFAADTVTANLVGDVTGNVSGTAASATNFTGTLVGDVTGTQGATVVSMVNGETAANIQAGATLANNATDSNTASAIVRRDGSGDFTAGTITASLSGNATTATNATNFTGALVGDVTGTQGATVVSMVNGETAANIQAGATLANNATDSNTASAIVRRDASGDFSAGIITANLVGDVTGNADTVSTVGGQTAANVASATIAANAATENDMADTIVLRDSSGDFATNMITLNGTVSNPTDATTKSYVDAAVAGGFTVKDAARVVSETNVATTGLQTIDGVLLGVNNRVLLVGQTVASQNGLWLVQLLGWTRPTDFPAGGTAGTAYVLILEGTANAGSSWVCTTPTATIDTNPITFTEFSIPGQTTGANVGAGAGQIFRDKTANVINFKTVAGGTHVTATNNANDVTISTDATDANTASTIVARDGSGNFSAGTITATLSGSATSATNFSGSLTGDVTGTQGATVVSMVNGETAANIEAGATLANDATDANTASAIVRRDGSGDFSAGTITANLTGAASLNVLKAGDTMTGSLKIPAGSVASPSINFTGSTTSGLSASGNNLSMSTNGAERMMISSSGTVSINQFSTAGVVHNDSSGNLSSSQIVNADVSASAAIADTKLATISTAGKVANSATTATSNNDPNTIVVRDGSGDFSAGMITANLTGSASGNVLKTGDTMTGSLTIPAGTAASPALKFAGSTNTGLSAATADRLSFDTNGTERMSISNTEISALVRFVFANLICNQAIQAVVPTVGGSVVVSASTSILILRHASNIGGAGFIVTFPANPTNGQFFTILCGTTNSVTLINDGNGASIVNPVIVLNPESNFTSSTNGASVTYFYYSPTNTWYRYGRG